MQTASVNENPQLVIEEINAAANYVSSLLPMELKHPQVGIICGSGLNKLGDAMQNAMTIPYSHIPHFPRSTVSGHQNAVKIGMLNGVVAVVFLGRFHGYEGHTLRATTRLVHLLAKLNVPNLIITNSCGSLDKSLVQTGDFMVVEDHISFPSFAGLSPLTGPNLTEFGPRFPPLQGCYHPQSYKWVLEAASKAGVPEDWIKKGVYVHIGGPSYETSAEVKALRILGGSAVGMSTAPEVIVAAHCKQIKKTVVLSLITNEPVLDGAVGPTHEEVLAVAAARAIEFQKLLMELAAIISQ